MTKKTLVLLVFLPVFFFVSSQKKDPTPAPSSSKYVISKTQKDTITERDRASQTLRNLRDGAVIVRLKTNEKSVEAYRKAGRNDIADKIIEDRKTQNQKLYYAFLNEFKFCRVYFIYANQTKYFLDGNQKVFLNKNLAVDTSIKFTDTTFVFCEYGSVEGFSNFGNVSNFQSDAGYVRVRPQRILDTIPTQTSTSPVTYSGLVFLDKELHQFYRPFPYVEGVYLDNFSPSVRSLNNEMERVYYRLVVKRDFNEKIKNAMKKQKQQLKQLK